jgi:hypothetical protein
VALPDSADADYITGQELGQAKEAQELSETGRTHGKLILKVA